MEKSKRKELVKERDHVQAQLAGIQSELKETWSPLIGPNQREPTQAEQDVARNRLTDRRDSLRAHLAELNQRLG